MSDENDVFKSVKDQWNDQRSSERQQEIVQLLRDILVELRTIRANTESTKVNLVNG